jgi:hypothetical protein
MSRNLLASAALAALLIGGCSTHYHVQSPRSGPHTRERVPTTRRAPNHPAPVRPAAFHVPPGHLPPPGQCRIWYPGTPPGQQPPSGDCAQLASQVPPGAWLISRGSKKAKEFDVAVYDDKRPGVLLEVRIFAEKDGAFLGYRKTWGY